MARYSKSIRLLSSIDFFNRLHQIQDGRYTKIYRECHSLNTLLHRALLTSFLCKQNETTVDIESAGHVSVLPEQMWLTTDRHIMKRHHKYVIMYDNV